MILIATFRKDDKPNGEFYRLLWEPRTGVVWTRRSFGEPRTWPTLYFAKRRFAVDVMVADVWGGRYPKTFKPIPRRADRDRAVPGPSYRSNSVSAPVGRDKNAQPRERRKRDEI
ncbi:MAG: hypothetical protein IJ991_13255 [Thermoguttaceae bacterium]|nr:hypothetical protein [Thermoguttaceae bacterium]